MDNHRSHHARAATGSVSEFPLGYGHQSVKASDKQHHTTPRRQRRLDLFGHVLGLDENTAARAMLLQNAVVAPENLHSRCESKLSCEFDDRNWVSGARLFSPFRVARQKAGNEGSVGDAGFAPIFSQPQQAATRCAVLVQIHQPAVERVRSRKA